jgi:hypothetical protein
MRILRIRLYIKGESYNNDRESRSESTRGDMREISVCISAIILLPRSICIPSAITTIKHYMHGA